MYGLCDAARAKDNDRCAAKRGKVRVGGVCAAIIKPESAGVLTVAVGSVMLSGFIGISASWHIDSEPAPTMMLAMIGFFSVALVVSRIRGMRMMRGYRPVGVKPKVFASAIERNGLLKIEVNYLAIKLAKRQDTDSFSAAS